MTKTELRDFYNDVLFRLHEQTARFSSDELVSFLDDLGNLNETGLPLLKLKNEGKVLVFVYSDKTERILDDDSLEACMKFISELKRGEKNEAC